ncbi:MAG: nucleotidyltransferase domain-containing protein [Candidatus Auribacterota bacterium]|nr:nucleotidyltransferase domain-containing protein [Candidatus Auribacterota bacterium]
MIQPLVHDYNPEQIILFGSYAGGSPTENSDVDLLIVLPFKGKSIHKAVEMRLKLKSSFPVDLVVRTPKKVRERLNMDDSFMKNVFQTGRILYEAHNTRMDR